MWLDLISEVLAGASAVLLWLPAWRLSRDLLAIKNLEPVASQHDWLARYAKKFSDAIREGHASFDGRDHRQLFWGFVFMVGSIALKIIGALASLAGANCKVC